MAEGYEAGNVVAINRDGDVLPAAGVVSEKLVDFLADQLERAKAGEIKGFVGAVMEKDRTGSYWLVGFTGGFSMLGALDCARHRLVRTAMGEK